ncbi:MAG: helix-turn-helix domain-containing protein [Formivibrio sp.]|nr:helix-turn-helix domain-containing protein [Formivibrio sp.]
MKTEYIHALPAHWLNVSEVYKALGDDWRQKILLLFEPNEELTIKQIVDVLPLGRTSVTHHINVLLDAGLLLSRKQGREVFLSLNKHILLEMLERTRKYIEEES